jgi:hypothetical protein
MNNGCKECGLPIYPPGITFTGQACWFGGNHPVNNVHTVSELSLLQPIKDLTDSIMKLTEAIEKGRD